MKPSLTEYRPRLKPTTLIWMCGELALVIVGLMIPVGVVAGVIQ